MVIIYDSLEKLQGISATWPDVLQSAERVLTRAGDAYRRVVLASGALDWLTRVVGEQALRLETDADRESADRMLAASVVLRYLNDTEWFELHPAVYEIPQLKLKRAESLEEKRQREP